MISYFFSHNQENSQSPLWWGQLVSQWAGLQSECLRRQRKKKNGLLGSSPCLFRAEKQEYYRSVTWYCGRERYVSFCSYVPYVLLLIASVFLRLPYESSKTRRFKTTQINRSFSRVQAFPDSLPELTAAICISILPDLWIESIFTRIIAFGTNLGFSFLTSSLPSLKWTPLGSTSAVLTLPPKARPFPNWVLPGKKGYQQEDLKMKRKRCFPDESAEDNTLAGR